MMNPELEPIDPPCGCDPGCGCDDEPEMDRADYDDYVAQMRDEARAEAREERRIHGE